MLRARQFFVSLATAAILAVLMAPSAMGVNYAVTANPYSASHILAPSDLWNTYELTAASGATVAYSINVTNVNGCAMLFFVKGHNANANSQYAPSYSQQNCVNRYSNSFPVGSSDGTAFTLLVMSNRNENVEYTITANVTTPIIPTWVLGLVVFIALIVVGTVVRTLIRRRRRPAMMPPYPPPTAPPMAPPYGPPPGPEQYPPQQPPYGPPPQQP